MQYQDHDDDFGYLVEEEKFFLSEKKCRKPGNTWEIDVKSSFLMNIISLSLSFSFPHTNINIHPPTHTLTHTHFNEKKTKQSSSENLWIFITVMANIIIFCWKYERLWSGICACCFVGHLTVGWKEKKNNMRWMRNETKRKKMFIVLDFVLLVIFVVAFLNF